MTRWAIVIMHAISIYLSVHNWFKLLLLLQPLMDNYETWWQWWPSHGPSGVFRNFGAEVPLWALGPIMWNFTIVVLDMHLLQITSSLVLISSQFTSNDLQVEVPSGGVQELMAHVPNQAHTLWILTGILGLRLVWALRDRSCAKHCKMLLSPTNFSAQYWIDVWS